MESPNPASRRGSGPPGAPDLVARAKSLCLGQSVGDTEAAHPGDGQPTGCSVKSTGHLSALRPGGRGRATKATTAHRPGDRTPGNVHLNPISLTPDPAGGWPPKLWVAGRSLTRPLQADHRSLESWWAPGLCAACAAGRALSSAGGARRRREERLAPGRELEQVWDPGTGPGGSSAECVSHWAGGVRRSGSEGPTHRDPGNALLALERHPDPRAGWESPVGAERAWTCWRGLARSLRTQECELVRRWAQISLFASGPRLPTFICIQAPPPPLVCACSLSPSPSLSFPFLFPPFPPQEHLRDWNHYTLCSVERDGLRLVRTNVYEVCTREKQERCVSPPSLVLWWPKAP